MAGELLNRGGVLDAVSKPIRTTVEEFFTYNNKGLVKKKTTVTTAVSLADVLIALVAAGIIFYGPEVADAIEQNPDLLIAAPFGIMGIIADVLYRSGQGENIRTLFTPRFI